MLSDDDFKQLSIEAGPLTGMAWVQTQRKAMCDLFITDENSNDSKIAIIALAVRVNATLVSLSTVGSLRKMLSSKIK
jgi:hypothetical protein